MALPDGFLDELKTRIRPSDLIGRTVALKRQGREFVGLSPFKKERTPSFFVNDEKGFYHCFASQEHGDVITWLQKTQGLSFIEAVEALASEVGMEVPKDAPPDPKAEARRRSALEWIEAAQAYFVRQLQSPQGEDARLYLERRGLKAKDIDAFGLGFAPDRRRGLVQALTQKGASIEDLNEAGLIIVPDDGGQPYDRFRGRVMFPIEDTRGRLVAFGGRAMSKEARAKYLNSPETSLFHKGSQLYRYPQARRFANDPKVKAKGLIVAEGYMDVIAFARAGLDHAVAPLGTALTEDQIGALWRLAAEPVLCLDGDAAGRRAATRAAERALPLLKPGLSLGFAFLPEGEDPDSLLTNVGATAVRAALERPAPLVEILWQQLIAGRRVDTPERRAGLRQAIDKLVATISDTTVRAQYQTEFRQRFDTAFAPPRRRGAQMAGRSRSNQPFQPAGPAPTTVPADEEGRRRERIMLVCLINHPALLEHVAEELSALSFSSDTLERFRRALAEIAAEGDVLDREGLRIALGGYASEGEIERLLGPIGWDGGHIAEAFARPEALEEDAARGFHHLAILHRRRAVEADLRAAEAVLADTMSEEALAHLVALRHQLHDIDTAQEATFGDGGREGLASRPLGTT